MRRLRPETVYLIYSVGEGFLFHLMSVLFSVFLIVELDLGPLQLLLMGTVLEGTYLLFEVPTGVVADTVSRRLSVVIGLVGSGAAFLLLGFSVSFAVAMVSQAVWGVFATFQSGADVAWLTDEIGEEAATPMYLRAEQWWQGGSLVGIAAGVGIASVSTLRTPIVVSGAGFIVLGIFMAVAMREEGFRPERREGERLHTSLVTTVREGVAIVRAHHVLLLVLATAVLHGMSTEGFDRLSDLHLLEDIGLPTVGGLDLPVWFGILDGGALLLGIAALAIVKRRAHLQGHAAVARVLAVVDVVLVVAVVAFALVASFWWALVAFWVVGTLRSVREPVFTAWINQGLDAKTRATINSVGGQADALGQSAGGPGIGLIARSVSVPTALVVSGVLRLPALFLYARAIRRGTVGTLAPDEIDEELHLEDVPATPTVPEGPDVPPER
ncbi:MAG: MFS transporter [Actinomycetota bacterium]|nr:MFS transporter [Actinomycetota bacterium]MDH5314477.1 MFS transporter [Actinomycetota bacterium]